MMHDLHEGVLTCFAEAARSGRRYRSVEHRFEGALSIAPYRQRERDLSSAELPALENAARRELARDAGERAERRREAMPDDERRARARASSRRYYRAHRARLLAYSRRYQRIYDARVKAEVLARRAAPTPIVPIAPVAVTPCACGGTWELRPGCRAPVHVGARCTLRRSA